MAPSSSPSSRWSRGVKPNFGTVPTRYSSMASSSPPGGTDGSVRFGTRASRSFSSASAPRSRSSPWSIWPLSSLRPASTSARRSGAALATSLPRRFCSARRLSTSVTRERLAASSSSSRSTASATPGPRRARDSRTISGLSRMSLRSSTLGLQESRAREKRTLTGRLLPGRSGSRSDDRLVGLAHGHGDGGPLVVGELVVGPPALDGLGIRARVGAPVDGRQDHAVARLVEQRGREGELAADVGEGVVAGEADRPDRRGEALAELGRLAADQLGGAREPQAERQHGEQQQGTHEQTRVHEDCQPLDRKGWHDEDDLLRSRAHGEDWGLPDPAGWTCRTHRSQDHRRLYNARTLDEGQLRQLLRAVARGELPTEDAVRRLTHLPFEDLGFARVDHHRSPRALGPEVVYARGKTPEETSAIVSSLLAQGGAPVLVTKASQAHADALLAAVPEAEWHPRAGMLVCRRLEPAGDAGLVLVACAGTSDLPVAEEAWLTAEAFGCRVDRLVDVGVAGAHRLFADTERLQAADVVIVVAGMEGALPSLVGGLVAAPVIAVPTSVGYGAAFEGLAALLGMLTSCAVGVAVVNIDNGFGAGALAARILAAGDRKATP